MCDITLPVDLVITESEDQTLTTCGGGGNSEYPLGSNITATKTAGVFIFQFKTETVPASSYEIYLNGTLHCKNINTGQISDRANTAVRDAGLSGWIYVNGEHIGYVYSWHYYDNTYLSKEKQNTITVFEILEGKELTWTDATTFTIQLEDAWVLNSGVLDMMCENFYGDSYYSVGYTPYSVKVSYCSDDSPKYLNAKPLGAGAGGLYKSEKTYTWLVSKLASSHINYTYNAMLDSFSSSLKTFKAPDTVTLIVKDTKGSELVNETVAKDGYVGTVVEDGLHGYYIAMGTGNVVEVEYTAQDIIQQMNASCPHIDFSKYMQSGEGSEEAEYGDPNSKYVVVLSRYRAKINEPIIVKVKNTQKAWWNPLDPEWIEGAEIYVDGEPTGIKTRDPDDWGWLDWFDDWLGLGSPDIPLAVIQISEPGEHYVYAKVGKEYSKAAIVTITSEEYDFDGGADSGTYPRTEPDEDNCHYELIYHPQSVKVGGSVTFKTVKICNGMQKEAVESTIFVGGYAIGEAKPELTWVFHDVGIHEVYAEVVTSSGVLRTGTGTVYVYGDIDEFDKDGGSLTLTVRVLDEHAKTPIPGAVVTILKGSEIVEQKVTSADGTASITVDAGVNYSIHVSDPSGEYKSRLIEDKQFSSSDTELVIYLRPAGDLDEDGDEDLATTRIELRIDGSRADGQIVWVGKHKISVVNEHRTELAGATIYLNGEEIGKTESSFFSAALYYDFTDPGNYTLKAEYEGLTDIAYIEVVDPNSYLLGWKLVKVPEQSSENTMGSAGLGAGIGAIIGALLGGGIGAIPGAAIGAGMGYGLYWAYDQVDEWFKSWQFGDVAVPVGTEMEFAILQNGKLVAGGELYVNGQKVATFVKEPARYTFDEAGVYNVTAVASTGEQVENEITVKVGSTSGFGGFLGQLASAYPILGNQAIDSILWAFILLIGGLIVVSLVLTLIRAIL